MNTTIRKGTLSDAIDAVSTLDIVDAFDIPNKTRRGRTYLLCPGHDDRHFGSCYIDKNDNGYYCYVCGEHVAKWQMVLKLNGNRKTDARDWFFRMSGLTPTEEQNYDDPYAKAVRLIRQLEPYVNNKAVYSDLYVCEKSESSYGRNAMGEYFYSEVTISNPLMHIYKTDKQMFKNFVTNMLNSEIAKIIKMMSSYQKNADDCVYIDGVGLICYSEMSDACNEKIERLRKLITATEQL